ncbi:16339_t:CDS:10 [Acaulospora morrowiae]|uniref:16339_t:CDS:1 n=1 Tax=Acaulospora morrowiae TaxID=94023 RepID=A0A9N8ZG72_9GLOM|nr:16339_t:CDS:10 [Acaulospora morrowiae]
MDRQNESSGAEVHQLPPPEESKENEKDLEHKALKAQLEKIFEPFDKTGLGRIVSKDLFKMIERFENEQKVILLKDDARPVFQMFCEQNPDMEVSIDDVLQLVTRLQTPGQLAPATPASSSVSTDPTSSRRSMIKLGSLRSSVRSSVGYGKNNRPNLRNREPAIASSENDAKESYDVSINSTGTTRSRRLSSGYYAKPFYNPTEELTETSFEGNGGFDESVSQLLLSTTDDPAAQLSRLYRYTVDLTKRLKDSENHLASVARQHEDRIEELQHRLEETKADLVAKKREIQNHKSKEKTNLHQISALEGEIQKVAKNLSGQKQLYHQLKKQYEERCEEAEKLKDLVRIKEEELGTTQRNLNQFSQEERRWVDDRERLELALSKLEQGVAAAQASEKELEEQKNENMHLKETIDKLKIDLEEIRSSRNNIKRYPFYITDYKLNEFDVVEAGTYKDLQTELFDQARASLSEEQQPGSDSNTDDFNRLTNKDSRHPNDASDGNTNDELPNSQYNDNERSLVEQSSRKSNGSRSNRRSLIPNNNSGMIRSNPTANREVGAQYQILSSELGVQYALIEGLIRTRDYPHDRRERQIRNSVDGENIDPRHQRMSRRKSSKRRANLIPDAEPSEKTDSQAVQSSKALVPCNNNNKLNVAQNNVIVNSTVTFALYTLVVYLFGIITSVFVLDNNQGTNMYSDWLPYEVVRDERWTTRSIEIILYWIETLLSDGNMRVPT